MSVDHECMCSCSPCIQGDCTKCNQVNAWCSDAVRAARAQAAEAKLDALARSITDDIEADAGDRRLFSDVDPDIRDEIRAAWRALVLKHLKEAL